MSVCLHVSQGCQHCHKKIMSSTSKQTGSDGEKLAEGYLKAQGYKIVGRNLSSKYGEVDLVARKKDHLFFVEIRTRVGKCYGSALESITDEKMRRIRNTAEVLLQKNKDWQTLVPFLSVIAIDEDEAGDVKIEFLPDAFE